MNKKFVFSGALVLVAALAVRVMWKPAKDGITATESVQAPILETGSAADQKVLQTALESPEGFQTLEKDEVESEPVIRQEKPRKLLSEVERPARERVQKEPVAASDLYFWKDYESLRKEEIRNPDSKENREGVVALMKARQRRVGQER